MHIHGTALDGIATYKEFFKTRRQSITDLITESASSPTEKQAELLARINRLQNDLGVANKVLDVLVKNITQLQV